MAKRRKKINKLHWDEANAILVDLLLEFYDKHGVNSPQILYKTVQGRSQLISNGNWFKNRETYNSDGLDPIQIFASFNNNRQRTEQRRSIFQEWINILNGKELITEINYQGCPAPLTIKILSGRKLEDQLQIWKVFYDIFKGKKTPLNDELLLEIKKWYGISFPSFTIFLYWIDPDKYLALDKNTTNYLIQNRKEFIVPKTFSEYHKLLKAIPSGLNKTIVSVAYDRSLVETLIPSKRSALSKFNTKEERHEVKEKNVSGAKIPFRLIGLNVKKELPLKLRKKLKEENYVFYKGYKFDGDQISIEEQCLFDLYSHETNNISISLHAVVGKNGSGKSALSELLFIAINNLYCQFTNDKQGNSFDWVSGINMQLFFQSFGVYRIDFTDNDVAVYEYLKIEGNKYQKAESPMSIDISFLEKFFYTLSVNYSLYGLNSKQATWLEKLFIKNDGYENPIVLEPNRVNGHINIHRQEELVRSRYLANLMELLELEGLEEKKESKNSVIAKSARFVRDDIEIKFIKLTINSQKTVVIFEKSDGTEIKLKEQIIDFDLIINSLITDFKLDAKDLRQIDFDNNESTESINLRYIIQKLYKIASQYKPYVNLFWDDQKEELIDPAGYIAKLKTDPTHVINKLFQAVNLLNKKISYTKASYDLDALLANITASKLEHLDHNENELETIHLLPPSFFISEIEVVDISSQSKTPFPFEQLSSGERQQIYSVNSIVYHLKNLDSIDFDERITYRCANIILDEVELYAHPEMQREYISDLLSLIKKFEWINVSGINICFITHSPFILSDIPSERILFLDQNGVPSMLVKTKTFGANIHELLVDGFFLSNTIGKFAITKIEDIVSFHSRVLEAGDKDLAELNDEYKLKSRIFEHTITSIGEDYLSRVLKNHITDIEKRLDKNYYQKEKLKELQQEVERITKQINA